MKTEKELLQLAGKLSSAVSCYLRSPVADSNAALEHMKQCLQEYDNAIVDNHLGR